jgi:hypothetical protein
MQAIRDFFPEDIRSALDVGCGDGKITHTLASGVGVPFVGLDSSVEALSRCRFRTVVGDATGLPFQGGEFEFVMTNDMLEHLPEDLEAQAWRELFRVAEKWVMVSVPFREELLDATAQCHSCGAKYHVNWHMRSYDIHQLLSRAQGGWRPVAIVLSGEPWSPMHPLETRFRRGVLGEWSGWAETMCPKCGASGSSAKEPAPIVAVAAAALGKIVYASLARQRALRSHSEIVVLFGRTDGLFFQRQDLPIATGVDRRASEIDLVQEALEMDLVPYPQKARAVREPDGNIVVQFPLYEVTNALHIRWSQPSPTQVVLTVEDALGQLFSGIVEPDAGNEQTVNLPRDAISGYYGVLVRLPSSAAVVGLSLSGGPVGICLEPHTSPGASYHRLSIGSCPIYIQVNARQWLDTDSLDAQISYRSEHEWQDLFSEIGHVAEIERKTLQHEADALAVQVQNLSAEREDLIERAREADALAVQVQNLSAEREDLIERAREADALTVEVQNLRDERDELRQQTDELHIRLTELSGLPEVRFARRLRQLLHSPQASSHPAPEKKEGKGAADE